MRKIIILSLILIGLLVLTESCSTRHHKPRCKNKAWSGNLFNTRIW